MDGNCWIEIQGTTEGWMHRPQKKKALRLILIFLIVFLLVFPCLHNQPIQVFLILNLDLQALFLKIVYILFTIQR